MPHRKSISLTVLIALVFIAVLTIPFKQTVKAQVSTASTGNNDSCIQCHEDLYFLHDTGKWYCIKESPMTCTGCHGGNGNATSKELAHASRAAHPIINEDVSKCQQCHTEQCDERVQIFREVAGISNVLVAAPYLPDMQAQEAALLPAQMTREQRSGSRVNLWGGHPVRPSRMCYSGGLCFLSLPSPSAVKLGIAPHSQVVEILFSQDLPHTP